MIIITTMIISPNSSEAGLLPSVSQVGMGLGLGFRVSRKLAVTHWESKKGTIIAMKDCQYEGEHPKPQSGNLKQKRRQGSGEPKQQDP